MNPIGSVPFQMLSPLVKKDGPPVSFICPITQDVMRNPVIDRHGHTFEETAINQWLKTKTTCPMNHQPITSAELVSNRALKEMIESYQAPEHSNSSKQEDENIPRPTKTQNDLLARPLIGSAQDLEGKGLFEEAEKLYLIALGFTAKSEDYAHFARLLVKKGEKERAASAFVVLADLQSAEGKQSEAITSLKRSLELFSTPKIKEKLGSLLQDNAQREEAAHLFLELAQQALYGKDIANATRFGGKALDLYPASAESWKTVAAIKHEQDPSVGLSMLLKGANEPSMPIKQRLELCRMATLKDPDHLQAKLLSFELSQLKMQDKLKRSKQAFNQVIQETQHFKQVIQEMQHFKQETDKKILLLTEENQKLQQIVPVKTTPLPAIAFGKDKWATYFGDIGQEPPLPSDIHQILNSPCPFWQGKKVEETHLLVLIPKKVNGQLLTLANLAQGIQKPKQGNATKFNSWSPGGNENLSIANSYWVLMTRDVLEGTRNKSYADQTQIVSGFRQKTGIDYQPPKLLEAAVCILMEHASKGTRLYSDSPWTFTRCQEKYENHDWQMVIGGFAVAGLVVSNGRYDGDAHRGLASLRKFSWS